MKRFIRVIAFLLMSACLLACVVACGNSNKQDKPNTNNNSNNNNNLENDVGIPMPEIRDFGAGPDDPYVYKALVRTGDSSAGTENGNNPTGNPYYAAIDFYTPNKDSKDVIEYAVYLRNSTIEQNYNVRIEQVPQSGDMTQQLRLAYMNGDEYDLTVILAKAAANAAMENLLSNLNNMPTLDLSHPSYDQKSIKELALGDALYYLSGDMNVSTLEVCGPTVVNLKMYDKYIEDFVESFDDKIYADIYNLVTAKKWTIETMLAMADRVNDDAESSDGPLGSHAEDVMGYFAYAGMGVYYFYGSGGRLTETDEEGNVNLVIEKYNNLYDYLFDKFNNQEGDNQSWLPVGYSNERWSIFSSGRCLFTEMTLYDIRVQLYPAEPFRYGILPNPTFEEGSDYHSVVNFTNCNHLWAIPNRVHNSEVAQQMMNIFAAYSNSEISGSTMNAYYMRTLYYTTAPDAGSRQVMNIIKDSMVYDIALLYDWDDMGSRTLGEMTISKRGLYATNVSNQNNIQKSLDQTVEQLKNPQMIK